jgi:hypothetical protein
LNLRRIVKLNLLPTALLLAALFSHCLAELAGFKTAPPVDCKQHFGPVPVFTSIFQQDGQFMQDYNNWILEGGQFLPQYLQNNRFVVQQRASSNFYFASYYDGGGQYWGQYIISFRARDGTNLSSWYLNGFDSCNLNHASESAYKDAVNIVLTEYSDHNESGK